MPDFYIVISFFHKKSKQARVPTFVWLFHDDTTIARGPGCDEGTNLRLRDFAVVQLMPTCVLSIPKTGVFLIDNGHHQLRICALLFLHVASPRINEARYFIISQIACRYTCIKNTVALVL